MRWTLSDEALANELYWEDLYGQHLDNLKDEYYENDGREPEEVWATCTDFPDYMISSHGRLWSMRSDRMISFQINSQTGYDQAKITDANGRKRHAYRHRLIAQEFVLNENPERNKVVRHLNDNCRDNRINNLMWGTQKENIADAKRNNRFPMLRTIVEDERTGERYAFRSSRDAADFLDVSPSLVCVAAKGRVRRIRKYYRVYTVEV